jgi:sec-independent protein translocase protein TatA
MTLTTGLLAFGIMGLGGGEIALIILLLVFFFGAKRIPDLARGLGKSITEFRKGKDEGITPEAPDKPTA